MNGSRKWNELKPTPAGSAIGALVIGLLLVSRVAAEPPAPTTATVGLSRPLSGGPTIQFVELTHDFGLMRQPAIAAHSFVFTNAGDAMLEIADVQPGCGCTTVGAWDRHVAPGQTGRIPVELASATLRGSVVRAITVTSNDPLQPSLLLRLSATVWTPVEVSPATVMFQFTTESTSVETQTVRIVNHQPEPLIVEMPRSTTAAFRAELRVVQPEQEFELKISTAPPSGATAVSGVVTVKTSAREMPLISVPAQAATRPSIVVSPTQIDLPGAPLAAAFNATVAIMGPASDPLVLSDPKLNFAGPEVQLREPEAGRVFSISVVFPAGFELPKNGAAEMTVKTNRSKFPVIRIPINQGGQSAL